MVFTVSMSKVAALLGMPCSMAHAGGWPRFPGFHDDMLLSAVDVYDYFSDSQSSIDTALAKGLTSKHSAASTLRNVGPIKSSRRRIRARSLLQ